MQYQTILFDLDGTLTDPFEGITKSFQYALEALGIHEENRASLRRVIGPPLSHSFRAYYGMSQEQTALAIERYRERFSTIGLYENRLYEGVSALLSTLRAQGIRLGVASSKAEIYVRQIVEHFGIAQQFDYIAGSELGGGRNEKEEVVDYALQCLGVTDKRSAVLVGDRKYDLIGAEKVGIDAIGVLYGYGDHVELSQYPHVFLAKNLEDLQGYLCNGN